MSDINRNEIPLSSKADAAFWQAARKVIQRARQTNTPVVVWEGNHIKEIPGDQLDAVLDHSQTEELGPEVY
jgi:hypothetical protein